MTLIMWIGLALYVILIGITVRNLIVAIVKDDWDDWSSFT